MSRPPLAAPALLLVLLFPGTAAAAQPTRAELINAHLAGAFRMAGVITAATGVRGEHRGQHVTRVWDFVGPCSRLPCTSVGLLRTRATGIAGTLLRRRDPSLYRGSGSFTLPVTCAGRRYASGLLVPFTVAVRVLGVRATAVGIVVSAIRASYASLPWTNRTPCFVVPGRDTARYSGVPS